jgi:beta-ureidopropionase / N-carbamoyl-L-amino-acid hydrolase
LIGALIEADAKRLHADFLALADIGATAGGGVSRTTFSDAHLQARSWFLKRAAEAGLEPRVDAAGNHSAVLAGESADGRTLLIGSHLDTVPEGGQFDGALGVLAALEAVRAVKDAGVRLPVALEAIDFTDEEGSLVGLLGSRAVAGALTDDMLDSPRAGKKRLLAGLTRAGVSQNQLKDARRARRALAGYLELHIEQGPLLEHHRVDIGVVTAISCSRSFRLVFEGAARHAGTTPMTSRRDALLGAARFALLVHETIVARFPGCVGTVGGIDVEPSVFNVVPARARLLLELRAPASEQVDALEAELFVAAQRAAALDGLGLTIERVGQWDPVKLDAEVQLVIERAAHDLGLSTLRLVSGAGHDAQALAPMTRTGMIFVPSVGGISHDPAEETSWLDCVNGANVLLRAALSLAQASPG